MNFKSTEFWKFFTFTPLFSLQPIDCPCSDCGAYIDSLNDRQTEENNSNRTTAVPESTLPTLITHSQKEYLVVDDSEQTLVKVDGSVKLQDKVKQKGCGFQIINGNITCFLIYCCYSHHFVLCIGNFLLETSSYLVQLFMIRINYKSSSFKLMTPIFQHLNEPARDILSLIAFSSKKKGSGEYLQTCRLKTAAASVHNV